MLRIPGSLLIAVLWTYLLEAAALFYSHPRDVSSVPPDTVSVILSEMFRNFLPLNLIMNLRLTKGMSCHWQVFVLFSISCHIVCDTITTLVLLRWLNVVPNIESTRSTFLAMEEECTDSGDRLLRLGSSLCHMLVVWCCHVKKPFLFQFPYPWNEMTNSTVITGLIHIKHHVSALYTNSLISVKYRGLSSTFIHTLCFWWDERTASSVYHASH